MAAKTIIMREDDLDGGPAEQTVRFGIGGAEYEIDLNAANADAFRSQISPFVAHARAVSQRHRRRATRTAASRERSARIRRWAKSQGIGLSDRGRIPASVIEQYNAATGARLFSGRRSHRAAPEWSARARVRAAAAGPAGPR
jgi:nucleoid-associated protein Lsr2